jgi:hypothetical protein
VNGGGRVEGAEYAEGGVFDAILRRIYLGGKERVENKSGSFHTGTSTDFCTFLSELQKKALLPKVG